MSNRIKILDPITANQIAAGEVVERPASVVKELVENAVDAGAGKIEVEVASAGVELIRVTDDGCGMQREDAVLAFQRHATSKIFSVSDLGAIATLGFRGEALPSIASVSNIEVFTREKQCIGGTRLFLSAGKVDHVQDTGCPVGTTINVRDLFFNTPARRKFLKSDATELGQISDIVNRLAMAYPGISFKLINRGRVLLHTPGNGSLMETVSRIYGIELAREMIPIMTEDGDLRVTGLLGRPHQTRSTRTKQTFFINSRYIRSKVLTEAVADGYHTLVPNNRYPLVILNLQVPPSAVDVNVHPTKLEVKFAKEGALVGFVAGAVRKTLTDNSLVPRVQSGYQCGPLAEPIPDGYKLPAKDYPLFPGEELYVQSVMTGQENLDNKAILLSSDLPGWIKDGYSNGSGETPSGNVTDSRTNLPVQETEKLPKSPDVTPDCPPENGSEEQKPSVAALAINALLHGSPEIDSRTCPLLEQESGKLPELQPLGQINLTYIVAKGQDGLYIIDQHAAHERLNYEKFWAQAAAGRLESQLLLNPITLELTNQEMELLLENILQFSDLGFLLEHFGGNTFLLRGYPANVDNPQSLVHDLLELFSNGEKTIDPRKLREEFIYMLACKASVKANQRLSMAEMEHLLWRLNQAENPFSCPHGRPTIIAISEAELAKRFHRV